MNIINRFYILIEYGIARISYMMGHREPEDLENTPNLFVGKLIGDKHLKGKVVSFDEDNIMMEIVLLNNEYYERYLDLGKTYPLFRHTHWNGDLLLWEVKPEAMKRDVSQILLQWEKDIGWTWDLDM